MVSLFKTHNHISLINSILIFFCFLFVVVLDEKYSSSFTGRWCDGCIGTTTFFRSFRIDSRRMDRYRAKTSRCNPESLLVIKTGGSPRVLWGRGGRARQMKVVIVQTERSLRDVVESGTWVGLTGCVGAPLRIWGAYCR